MQRGFTRLYVNGQTIELRSPDDYTLDTFDNVFVMVDRQVDVARRLFGQLDGPPQPDFGRPPFRPHDGAVSWRSWR